MQRARLKGDEVTPSSSSHATAQVNTSTSQSEKNNRSELDDKESKGGIFKVRGSNSCLTPNIKQELLANLGVSSDSTEPETISVDLPTITVSEDDLHDNFSDLESDSDDNLEDLEKIGREMASASSPYDYSTESPITVSTGKPPIGPSSGSHLKRASSSASLTDTTTTTASPMRSHSIRDKVKQFGGKVKNVSGRVKGIIVNNLRRSHDDVSTVATRSSSPTTSGTTVIDSESDMKLQLKKKELDLKRKEKELKELQANNKKDDEKLKKFHKSEEEKLMKWEQELKKKEQNIFDRLNAKEQLLLKREKEIAQKEAHLKEKEAQFEVLCRKVKSQIDDAKNASTDKDGISLRASSPNYDSTGVTRVSGSVSQLNIDEPNKPPRQVAGKVTASDDIRRKLPPPPRPPLPPATSAVAPSASPHHKEPIYARIIPKPPKSSCVPTPQVSSSLSQCSSHDTSMKTALSAPYNSTDQSNTLFRISPASSNESTLYCSDFVDIPLDDDATLRGSVSNNSFDPKSYYKMIVARWRATHPRRILKDTPPPKRDTRYKLYCNLFSRNESSNSRYSGSGRGQPNVHLTRRGITYYSNPPSRQPIYQMVSDTHNYRLQRRKVFYKSMQENNYDELIFPIGPNGIASGNPAYNLFHQPLPLPPPRAKRNKVNFVDTSYRRLPPPRCNVLSMAMDTDGSTTGGGYSLPTTTTGSSSSLNALMVSEDESRETITN